MKYDKMHMATAEAYASESRCPRTHVGCALVLASGVISGGFNGHASGGPNEWEFSPDGNPEVVHAELNSLGKCLEQGLSTKEATMYVTLSPCLECSKLLVRAGVKRVVYRDEYRNLSGVDYLLKYNVIVDKLGLSDWGSQPYLLRQAGVDERGRRLSHVVQKEEI
ncbi:dCMP deaminase [Pseudomonas phage PHB09]|uniref:dCMP deaminase n=1 Tax=Pseudomonas phage PHB09 TaxID=2867265 RepID=A0AAE9BND4_9CAUD|nr:dCMP deaminase [Pseudomonas phage PHB09]UAV84511.1 dCMP deaminase [Pseudomonas phage PHB09]